MLPACTSPEDKVLITLPNVDAQALYPVALTVQANNLKVQQGYYTVYNNLMTAIGLMLGDVEKMSGRVMETFDLTLMLADKMAQAFVMDAAFSTEFQVLDLSLVDQNTPPFQLNVAQVSEPVFLLSSNTKLFVPRHTVKTLFNTAQQLRSAWQRALVSHNGTRLYLSLERIASDGSMTRLKYALTIENPTALVNPTPVSS